jgi:hypothetical protein
MGQARSGEADARAVLGSRGCPAVGRGVRVPAAGGTNVGAIAIPITTLAEVTGLDQGDLLTAAITRPPVVGRR